MNLITLIKLDLNDLDIFDLNTKSLNSSKPKYQTHALYRKG